MLWLMCSPSPCSLSSSPPSFPFCFVAVRYYLHVSCAGSLVHTQHSVAILRWSFHNNFQNFLQCRPCQEFWTCEFFIRRMLNLCLAAVFLHSWTSVTEFMEDHAWDTLYIVPNTFVFLQNAVMLASPSRKILRRSAW